jgi:phosphotransferase system HPr-like phosphotransfer protein
MFGKYYGANNAAKNADSIVATTSGSVDASNSVNIIAPGTKNDTGIQIKISGQPEVAFKVAAEGTVAKEIFLAAGEYGVMIDAHGINAATDFTKNDLYTLTGDTYTVADAYVAGTKYYRLTNYVDVEAYYNPITWTGKVVSTGTTGESSGKWYQEFATLKDAVTALTTQINEIGENDNGTFAANDKINNVYTLVWSWDFEKALAYADGADTILGDLIAGGRRVVKLSGNTATAPVESTDYCLNIDCKIGASATQVD